MTEEYPVTLISKHVTYPPSDLTVTQIKGVRVCRDLDWQGDLADHYDQVKHAPTQPRRLPLLCRAGERTMHREWARQPISPGRGHKQRSRSNSRSDQKWAAFTNRPRFPGRNRHAHAAEPARDGAPNNHEGGLTPAEGIPGG